MRASVSVSVAVSVSNQDGISLACILIDVAFNTS